MLNFFNEHIILQINFETLAILFCLMGIVAGFSKLGYIDLLSAKLVKLAGSYKTLQGMLVFMCFFISMLVTNDVALIIIVPFTIKILEEGKDKSLIKIIVLETIAANLGSMATPIGNPQNLYLYQFYNMDLSEFFKTMFPYIILSMILLLVILISDKSKLEIKDIKVSIKRDGNNYIRYIKTIIYTILFILSICVVLGITNYILCLSVVVVCMFLCDKSVFKDINYGLLIKFIILFLLVGNVATIPFINEQLKNIVLGNEFIIGILLSQFISNVPAAIMLSKFTNNGTCLLLGVDIGGLGTLIASMASMISFDFYVKTKNSEKGKYIKQFSLYNGIFFVAVIVLKILTTYIL